MGLYLKETHSHSEGILGLNLIKSSPKLVVLNKYGVRFHYYPRTAIPKVQAVVAPYRNEHNTGAPQNQEFTPLSIWLHYLKDEYYRLKV